MSRKTFNVLLMLIDIFSIYFSIVLAFYSRYVLSLFIQIIPLTHGLDTYLYNPLGVVVIIILIAYYKGYNLVINIWDEILIFLKALTFSFLIIWMMISLRKVGEEVSRIIITLSFLYMLFFIPLFRFMAKYIIFKVKDLRKPAYIIKKDEKGNDTIETLTSIINKEWYSGYKIVDSLNSIDKIKEKQIDVCFVPIKSVSEKEVRFIKPYVKQFILISDVPGLSFMNTEIKTFLSNNIALITVSKGLLSVQKVFIKRAFDIFFSILCMVICSPLFLIISVLIKIDSKGPVIFRHKRCGKNMHEFEMLKFRTMKISKDIEISDFLMKNPDAFTEFTETNKLKNDPRVTKIGKVLRKTSLDELPQLYNVLRGDMSIVGPRPDSKSAIEQYYKDYEEIYAHTRPGITGLWQVSGRSDIKYADRVKLDYFYVLNWSMWLDIVIIIKTFKAIITAKGAY